MEFSAATIVYTSAVGEITSSVKSENREQPRENYQLRLKVRFQQ
jgi:hypothetical protein